MFANTASVLLALAGPAAAFAQCYEDTGCFYGCPLGYYQHAGSLLGCTDLCCPLSFHPLHMPPIMIHHAAPVTVHHTTYHSSYHPPTTYHSTYHPSTYHRTSYYRHYMMIESPQKLLAGRVAMGGSAVLVLVSGILWISHRQRSRLPML